MDYYASHRHLVDHLAPLWHAQTPEERGRFMVGRRHLVDYAAAAWSIPTEWDEPATPGGLTVVASHADYTRCAKDRPIAYVEHGAGQTYRDHDWHPAYSGGDSRDRVVLFLTLNDTTAEREAARYPNAEVIVVGSMRLDSLRPAVEDRPARTGPPVIACTWHWNLGLVPETKPAWEHWRAKFTELAAEGWVILGHAHPRAYAEMIRHYERRGIEPVEDFTDVLRRADVLCFDNTSAGYEAAALGVPVVALNAPWYRRHVHHGLRFWNRVPGPQVDHPERLAAAIAASQTPRWAEVRRIVTDDVYPLRTRGVAATLAANAVRRIRSNMTAAV